METQPQPRFFKQEGKSLKSRSEQVSQFFDKNAQMPLVRNLENK